MVVIPTKQFEKAVSKLPKKIKDVLNERLGIFMNNPRDQRLKNHQLKGSLRCYRSILISSDYRLIYEEYEKDVIRLIDIGTYNQVYGR